MRGEFIIEQAGTHPAEFGFLRGGQQLVERGGAAGEVGFGFQRPGGLLECEGEFGFVRVGGFEDVTQLRADGQRFRLCQRVKQNVIAENVSLQREQERMARAFETLEKIRADVADEPLAGAVQIGQQDLFGIVGRWLRMQVKILLQAVARQMQAANGVHDGGREQRGVLIALVAFINVELDRARLAFWEIRAASVGVGDEVAVARLVLLRVVLLDERARTAHQKEPHQVTPVVGERTRLKRTQRLGIDLELRNVFGGEITQPTFGTHAEIVIVGKKQPELIGDIGEFLVERRGREQHGELRVLRDVISDGEIATALAIPQVVAFVNDHEPMADELREIIHNFAKRHDAPAQSVALAVVLPHWHKIRRTQDEGLQVVAVFHQSGERRRHESFSKTDHVTEQHAATFFQMSGGNEHGGALEWEKFLMELFRQFVAVLAVTRFLGKMPRHFEINVVRRQEVGPRPTLINDVGKFVGNIETPAVRPAVVKPLGEFVRRVVIKHVHVQFTLRAQTGKCEVAAAEKTGDGVVGVGAEAEIKFGVKRMREKQLHGEFLRAKLTGQTTKRGFIVARGTSPSELILEGFRRLLPHPFSGGVVQKFAAPHALQRIAEFRLLQSLHPDQQTTLLPVTARPRFDMCVYRFPTAQVEIADAKIGTVGDGEGLPQSGQQIGLDVIEDTGHGCSLARESACCGGDCPLWELRCLK